MLHRPPDTSGCRSSLPPHNHPTYEERRESLTLIYLRDLASELDPADPLRAEHLRIAEISIRAATPAVFSQLILDWMVGPT